MCLGQSKPFPSLILDLYCVFGLFSFFSLFVCSFILDFYCFVCPIFSRLYLYCFIFGFVSLYIYFCIILYLDLYCFVCFIFSRFRFVGFQGKVELDQWGEILLACEVHWYWYDIVILGVSYVAILWYCDIVMMCFWRFSYVPWICRPRHVSLLRCTLEIEIHTWVMQLRNTVEKYSLWIQLRNTIEKYSWEILLRNTVEKYSLEMQFRNTVEKYSREIQLRNIV